jgi:hypothetical protein
MEECDDGTWSEITILPDGRIYLFGMTLSLLEMLAALPTREDQWKTLLAHSQASIKSEASAACTPQEEPSCD